MIRCSSYILSLLITLSCGIAAAQTQTSTLEDVDWEIVNSSEILYKSINGHGANNNLIRLPDNSTVALVINKKGEFAASVITEDMKFKWNTELSGYPFGIGKFKGNILVIAAKNKTFFQSYDNNYMAYILDPQSGKVVLEKQIYTGSTEFMEFPNFMFSENGDYFKFSVRESAIKRKVHVGLPGLGSIFSIKNLIDQALTTRSFSLYTLNEDLTTDTIKPVLKGTLAGVLANKNGDAFIMSLVDKSIISVAMYENGKSEAIKVIDQPLDGRLKGLFTNISIIQNFHYTDCTIEPLKIYWAMMVNDGDGNNILISGLDFKNNTYKMEKVNFTSAKLRDMEKRYVTINKKIDRPEFGFVNNLNVRSIYEADKKIFIGVGSVGAISGRHGTIYTASSEILTALNTDLKVLFQQSIPRSLSVRDPLKFREVSYDHSQKGVIRFIANRSGLLSIGDPIYGEMDSSDGKMLKLDKLSRSGISDKTFVNAASVIWNKENFIVPYFQHKGLILKNFDVSLSSYSY